MKNIKIRTSPLTLSEHFGAARQTTVSQKPNSCSNSPWVYVLAGVCLGVGVALLVYLPKATPYITKEEALAESLKNDELHVEHQRRHNVSHAKVKHEIRKVNRRQRALKRRVEDLEYDLFENA